MTISPPSNVIPYQVLASGIDTMVLAIDATWKDESFFDYLTEMKSLAIQVGNDVAAIIRSSHGDDLWLCKIKPHGSKGYEWVLEGSDYNLTIGNWLKPKSRPSIMAQIRSETLWHVGPEEAVEFLFQILTKSGAEKIFIKSSRVDLCVDLTLPADLWTADLVKYRVTRANYAAPHYFNDDLQGISIGKGKMSGRLYDKPLEIRQKSKKFWMFDVWGIEIIPDDLKVIRVEGQFRRECIKELGVDSVVDLFPHIENFWAYFTKNWLKFQDNPGKHSNLRNTFAWWEIIQNGFLGVQGATPSIRCKSLSTSKKQLFAQTYGTLNSMMAIEQDEQGHSLQKQISFEEGLIDFMQCVDLYGKNEFDLNNDILRKRAKYQSQIQKMLDVDQKRRDLGHPSNLPVGKIFHEQMEKEERHKNTLQILDSVKKAKINRELSGVLYGRKCLKKTFTS